MEGDTCVTVIFSGLNLSLSIRTSSPVTCYLYKIALFDILPTFGGCTQFSIIVS